MDKKYYDYYESPIGTIEITSNGKGITSVNFVQNTNNIQNSDEVTKECIRQLKEYFSGERIKFDIKLYIDGTDFRKTVWNELLNIPYGETISYKELAIRIGNEKASRAVGNANNKNQIGLIIPCHRVIGSNSKLVGYAGGLDKKKWLLDHERRVSDINKNKNMK